LAIDWLDSLESTVRDAVARLDELKEENASLRDRIRSLETEAAAAPPALALPFEDSDRDEEAETLRAQVRSLEERLAAAEAEREEVRRRVEGLTERLTGLMGG
jgi:chromosome segregation ATPase